MTLRGQSHQSLPVNVLIPLLLVSVGLLFTTPAFPQTNISVVDGQVQDPSGAVIPDCEVVLTSLSTGGAPLDFDIQ